VITSFCAFRQFLAANFGRLPYAGRILCLPLLGCLFVFVWPFGMMDYAEEPSLSSGDTVTGRPSQSVSYKRIIISARRQREDGRIGCLA
jgi:hypothetical protein